MADSFGERLRKCRQRNNMTQKELADAISKYRNSIMHNTISNWENNINVPDIRSVTILCNILHTDSNYLLGLDNVDLARKKELIKILDGIQDDKLEEIIRYAKYLKEKED